MACPLMQFLQYYNQPPAHCCNLIAGSYYMGYCLNGNDDQELWQLDKCAPW